MFIEVLNHVNTLKKEHYDAKNINGTFDIVYYYIFFSSTKLVFTED